MNSPDHKSISVSLLTGFLGSGKTTLLNRLLSDPQMGETAVLINEFGEIGLDHLIVQKLDEDIVLLKSGCICCTVQGQLVDGLKELYLKRLAGQIPAFKRLVIETTGLADPLPIIDCLMRDPLFKRVYSLDTVITTVDSGYGEAQLESHPEAMHQAMVADSIVLTKGDLANKPALKSLKKRLAGLNPAATVLAASFGHVRPDELFGSAAFDIHRKSLDVRAWFKEQQGDGPAGGGHDHSHGHDHDHHDHGHDHGEPAHEHPDVSRHDARIGSFCIVLDEPLSWDSFSRWYEQLAEKKADGLLRVKGIVNIEETGAPAFVHCVHATMHEPEPLAGWPDSDHRSRIVFITRDLPRAEVEQSLRSWLAERSGDRRPAGTTPIKAPVRSGWLNPAELSRLFAALLGEPGRAAADMLRFMLLTGVNAEEARAARWEQIDLAAHEWRAPLPGAANRPIGMRFRCVPLHDSIHLLLSEMHRDGPAVGFLFGDGQTQIPREQVEHAWNTAVKAGGVGAPPLAELQPVLAIDLFEKLPLPLSQALLGLGGRIRKVA